MGRKNTEETRKKYIMGVGISWGRNSSSTYDQNNYRVGNTFSVIHYSIINHVQIDNYLLIQIKYHDCKNYEGNKILLYENCDITKLKNQLTIDPHFSDNKNFHSPIARFEPNVDGWNMGFVIATVYTNSIENKTE